MKGYDRLNLHNRSNQIYLSFFTLCIRSSSSLVPLYLKSSTIFGSTSTRGVLAGLPMPRHTLGSFLPDGVPPGRRDLGLLQTRRRSAPSWTVWALGADRPDVRRGGAAPATRLQTVWLCVADSPRLRGESRQAVLSSVWHPDRRQHTFWQLCWRPGV
jgi:hypothetical protein